MPSVKRAAVVTIERDGVGDALARVQAVAERCGVTLVDGDDADIAIVLGGDGTMLRALARFLGAGVPVIGVNYGRVGFLTAIAADELDAALTRVFAGEYRTVELSTLEVSVAGGTSVAINDVVLNDQVYGSRIDIQPTGAPSLVVSVSHVRVDPSLVVGSPVTAAGSKLGSVVDFTHAERQALARYTNDSGNHVVIEVHPSATLSLD